MQGQGEKGKAKKSLQACELIHSNNNSFMDQKKINSIDEFISNRTEQFRNSFIEKNLVFKNRYFLSNYTKLAKCYSDHVHDDGDSDGILAYFDCYKNLMMKFKKNNQNLYVIGVDAERKLYQCFRKKSNVIEDRVLFEAECELCLSDYERRFNNLYSEFYKDVLNGQ